MRDCRSATLERTQVVHSSASLMSPSSSSFSSGLNDLLSPSPWAHPAGHWWEGAWTLEAQRASFAAMECSWFSWSFLAMNDRKQTDSWSPERWTERPGSCWARRKRKEVKGRNIWIGASEMDALGFSCHLALQVSGCSSPSWWWRGASAAGPPPEWEAPTPESCPAPSPTCARSRRPSSPRAAWCPWCCSPWRRRPAAPSSSARPGSPAWRAPREVNQRHGEGAWGSGEQCGCEGSGCGAVEEGLAGGSPLSWSSKARWGMAGTWSNAGLWEPGTECCWVHLHLHCPALRWCCLQWKTDIIN